MSSSSGAAAAIAAPAARSADLPPALEVRAVSHRFGALQALKDVSFQIGRGEFCTLLGVNGAGKTTLFSLITRLYTSTSGYIGVAGHDARRAPREALSRIGVVFQSRALDGDLTLTQNLQYHAALHGISRPKARIRIGEVLELVGLSDKAGARASTLSGGQQRRAEVARALLHRPELLLLDEATAGLDLRARADLLSLVRRLIASEGVSTLWATHIFEEIAPQDHIVVLHKGAVLADASAAALAAGGDLGEAFLSLTGGAR
ncbi:ATP-binding cassette domain-containing protein [Pseudogemmobacter faecipullorum]|uniref:ATP-binding cassette domain-containing protein n=1 Tax=Pseudogemmobacter faecipullorum TaxID=2755041 RepID=A0ABS8CIM7_9RHOB|nr:ATP-binding cassette domain-containing protein [Pseudogemmobacter faecipullorum]MCB5409219.1 ATP-binding cassette domain-containing protein [Pseudogemmobacter faecipullorum]